MVSPLIEKPDPLTLACEIVTEDVDVFDRVSCRVFLLPTVTVPKFRLLVERAMLLPLFAGASPWHAVSNRRQPVARKRVNQIGRSRNLFTMTSAGADYCTWEEGSPEDDFRPRAVLVWRRRSRTTRFRKRPQAKAQGQCQNGNRISVACCTAVLGLGWAERGSL